MTYKPQTISRERKEKKGEKKEATTSIKDEEETEKAKKDENMDNKPNRNNKKELTNENEKLTDTALQEDWDEFANDWHNLQEDWNQTHGKIKQQDKNVTASPADNVKNLNSTRTKTFTKTKHD